MKLVLDEVYPGTYNNDELHALIEIQDDLQLKSLEPFQYCAFLNEKVLPVLKENFKAKNHIIHEFLYEDQGFPLTLKITAKTHSKNIPSLTKNLEECINASNITLIDLRLKNNIGLFAQPSRKVDKSESNSTHHNII